MSSFIPSNGVFQPEELAEMKAVFDEVTSEPWFSRRIHARRAFALYLLENFPGGTYDPVRHRCVVEDAARKYFAWAPGENSADIRW